MKKIVRLTESDLHKIVKESVNRILFGCFNKDDMSIVNESQLGVIGGLLLRESSMDFGGLYGASDGDDITSYVRQYIEWSFYGENGSSSFSILASKLHDALMCTFGLEHNEESDRKAFVRILNYCRSIDATVGIDRIEYECGRWLIYTKSDEIGHNIIYVDAWDFKDGFMPGGIKMLGLSIAYETQDGFRVLDDEYRPGSDNGSCGIYITSAVMDEDMKRKIYSMKLVPALYVEGSYHENWVYCVGILPQFVSKIKSEDRLKKSVYFECRF